MFNLSFYLSPKYIRCPLSDVSELQVELGQVQSLFEHYVDSLIISGIQEDAQALWPQGIDDPAYG